MANQNDQDWQLTKKTVLERNRYMFNNPLISDITFTCGESKRKYFYGHKYVLATSSPVFYAMFYGNLAEEKSVIHLPDTDEETLEAFLRFLYTDECTTVPEIALNMTYLSMKYMVVSLTERCVELLTENLSAENVLAVLGQALHLNEKELEKNCWEFVDLHTRATLESSAFLDVNRNTLSNLLKRDTLKIGELELFHAVLKWTDHHCELKAQDAILDSRRLLLGDMVYHLRFLLMSKIEFTKEVATAGLLTQEEVASILGKFEGQNPADFMWPVTKQRSYFIRAACSRISVKNSRQGWISEMASWVSRMVDDDWRFKIWNTSYLRFKVNSPTLLHGIRLLGDADQSQYDIAIEIEGLDKTIDGKYTSVYEDFGQSYGFDVILPAPLAVNPHQFVGISVSVREPQSYYVVNKLENTTIGGINVDFDHQYTKRGDIYQVILRCAPP